MATDNLLAMRKTSKGALTATETALSNAIVVPPGVYDVQVIVPIAATGTTPVCTIDLQDSADGATFAPLVDDRTRTLPVAKALFFFRGVRVVRWANGLPNFGALLTVTGTTPSFGAVEIQLYPPGNASQSWNGTP